MLSEPVGRCDGRSERREPRALRVPEAMERAARRRWCRVQRRLSDLCEPEQ